MTWFDGRDDRALVERVSDLETQLTRMQRLVRVMAVAFLVLAGVVLLPIVLDVAGVLLMIAGGAWIVRSLLEGQTDRLVAPLRWIGQKIRAP